MGIITAAFRGGMTAPVHASTAVENGMPLATGNAAHFSYLPELTVERFHYA